MVSVVVEQRATIAVAAAATATRITRIHHSFTLGEDEGETLDGTTLSSIGPFSRLTTVLRSIEYDTTKISATLDPLLSLSLTQTLQHSPTIACNI
jgi:hypothetical protein